MSESIYSPKRMDSMLSSETSTLSCVKLRSEVAIIRIRRSKTMSSIGSRSYDTMEEFKIAWTPVFIV